MTLQLQKGHGSSYQPKIIVSSVPNFLSRHDATVPERSWSQLPNHKEIILGFVLIVSPQESSQEKGALQCRRPQKRAPSRTEKERKDLLELFSDL